MNILILGDVFGPPGMKVVTEKLPDIINNKKIDFVIINAENSGDRGVGITKKNAEKLFEAGADVITSGNHIWGEKEVLEFIELEKRLLRPLNLITGSPGKGYGIFNSKNNKKVAVLNLMGNVFMKKSEDVFEAAKKFIKDNELKKMQILLLLICMEKLQVKMAMGYLFDGKATLVVELYTHVPTSDYKIMVRNSLSN